MDSMRSLKGSLPSTSASRRQESGGNMLFPTFQQAAVSLTALFKKAQDEQVRAEEEGYQNALLDLMGFLDQENLGLQDGEGWRVREWITSRLQGRQAQGQSPGESDEEQEDDKRARSSSPVPDANSKESDSTEAPSSNKPDPLLARAESAPPVPNATQTTVSEPLRKATLNFTVPSADFTFQSSHQPPSVAEMDIETTTPSHSPNPQHGTMPTVLFNFVQPSRQPKTPSRHSRSSRQNNTPLGPGAGTKRNTPFSGYFDLGDFGGRDGFGGGKRGRHS